MRSKYNWNEKHKFYWNISAATARSTSETACEYRRRMIALILGYFDFIHDCILPVHTTEANYFAQPKSYYCYLPRNVQKWRASLFASAFYIEKTASKWRDPHLHGMNAPKDIALAKLVSLSVSRQNGFLSEKYFSNSFVVFFSVHSAIHSLYAPRRTSSKI